MAKLAWDETGERLFETGVSNGVLYPMTTTSGVAGYGKGVPWNGLTSVTESPSGAESNPLFADNTKYLSLTSAEEFGATVEAYTFPDEFMACDGSAELTAGINIGQQSRNAFGLCYKTLIGNDTDGNDHGYKLHLLYGCKASPSERAYQTVNDSPEAITFSWEVTTTPVAVAGFKPTACLIIDSTKCNADVLADIEALIWGSEAEDASLPTPDEILALIALG